MSEISEAFRLAKKRLKILPYCAGYICVALHQLNEEKKITRHQYEECRNIIHTRLGSQTNLYDWLRHRYYFPDVPYTTIHRKLKETRLAWLDSLIKEYE